MSDKLFDKDPSFTGTGSAVFMVTELEHSTGNEYCFRGVGFGSFYGLIDIRVYIFDNRLDPHVKKHYIETFTVGTFWRLSGCVELEDGDLVFIDPVYMPYCNDEYREKLKYLMENRIQNNSQI